MAQGIHLALARLTLALVVGLDDGVVLDTDDGHPIGRVTENSCRKWSKPRMASSGDRSAALMGFRSTHVTRESSRASTGSMSTPSTCLVDRPSRGSCAPGRSQHGGSCGVDADIVWNTVEHDLPL